MEATNINRPRGLINPQGLYLPSSFDNLAYRGDLNGGASLVYIGFAKPGTAEGTAAWKIFKIAYSGTTPISITWPIGADGGVSNDYAFSWTGRAGYTYS